MKKCNKELLKMAEVNAISWKFANFEFQMRTKLVIMITISIANMFQKPQEKYVRNRKAMSRG